MRVRRWRSVRVAWLCWPRWSFTPAEYVPKAKIMDVAWPGLVVEEANLAVQISAIRRALGRVPGGDRWIETLARRGYRFVGPVATISDRRPVAPVLSDGARTNLPQVLTSFVGREREVAEIKRLLPATRLLTLTGTGGIGKTRLALQAAAEVLDAYPDGVWFIDLAPLLDPAMVPSALAQVLRVKESAHQLLLKSLCECLRDQEVLIILDNCEHVLGACAHLVDTLLRETARTGIVATSREPLRTAAERTYALNVLTLPDRTADAAHIERSDPAVRLFVDAAAASTQVRFGRGAITRRRHALHTPRWPAARIGTSGRARGGAAGGGDRAPA